MPTMTGFQLYPVDGVAAKPLLTDGRETALIKSPMAPPDGQPDHEEDKDQDDASPLVAGDLAVHKSKSYGTRDAGLRTARSTVDS